jgi:hypothetical protein
MRKAVFLFLTAALYSGEMTQPRFTKADALIRPEGYRHWMFVGANYGMGYTEGDPKAQAKPSTFHNVYIQPEAFKQYEATGRFPDKTMLVMEVVKPGTNASINRRGMFQDEYIGIEVALKDEKRFDGKWAYFNFIGAAGKPLAESKAFPKESCWSCHNQHGAVDNVFVQFYPVLRAARPVK